MSIAGEHVGGGARVYGVGNTPINVVVQRLKIVEYLTETEAKRGYAISMGHLKSSCTSSTLSLTDDGYDYWKDVI